MVYKTKKRKYYLYIREKISKRWKRNDETRFNDLDDITECIHIYVTQTNLISYPIDLFAYCVVIKVLLMIRYDFL